MATTIFVIRNYCGNFTCTDFLLMTILCNRKIVCPFLYLKYVLSIFCYSSVQFYFASFHNPSSEYIFIMFWKDTYFVYFYPFRRRIFHSYIDFYNGNIEFFVNSLLVILPLCNYRIYNVEQNQYSDGQSFSIFNLDTFLPFIM